MDTSGLTGHGTGGYESPHERAKEYQAARNAHWPPPATGRALRERPDRIDVWARIEWEGDGEEWISGRATRWDQRHVFVRADDRRLQIGAVWLRPSDIRRRHDGDQAPPGVASAR